MGLTHCQTGQDHMQRGIAAAFPDIVGSANISANVSQPGYNSIIPFGIPVTISPMTWTISLAVETINTELAYQRVEATFFPMMTIIIPSESHLIDGTLSLNTQDAGVQFLNPAAFKALNISLNIDGLAPSQFPLGARFIRGFMQCLMSAVSGDVPKILIESRVDLKVGALQLNGIPLRRVIDVGKILVQNAMPFPMVGSKSQMISSDPDDMFQFGNLVPILTDGAGNVEIAFPKSRYPVNPISVSFTSLRMRFNVSNVPVYMVAAPVIHEVQGSQNISFSVKTTPIGTAGVTLVSSFLFQDQSRLRLGIDSVDVRDAIGGKIQWLSDMCRWYLGSNSFQCFWKAAQILIIIQYASLFV
ncbi:hypothetical protein BDR26DRAFT_891831 [Obelidium mucronatum]|nr:hypothetical protein BDR26DRAFT_891831 [Obelidium mucronatum]